MVWHWIKSLTSIASLTPRNSPRRWMLRAHLVLQMGKLRQGAGSSTLAIEIFRSGGQGTQLGGVGLSDPKNARPEFGGFSSLSGPSCPCLPRAAVVLNVEF